MALNPVGWRAGAAEGAAWQAPGLTPEERTAVITVSVVGGVVILLLSGVFLYYKYREMTRYLKTREFEESMRIRRQSKFQPLPA